MKKVLSFVLALMMVVGMSTVAFADAGDVANPDSESVGAISVTVAPGKTEKKNVNLPGKVTVELGADLAALSGTVTPTGAPSDVTITAKALNTGAVIDNSKMYAKVIEVSFAAAPDAKNFSDKIYLDIKFGSGTGSIVIPVNLTVGAAEEEETSTGGYVDAKYKIVGFNPDFNKNKNWTPDGELSEANQSSILRITPDMFKWEDKDGKTVAPKANEKIRASQLKDIGVRRVYQKGTANTIRDVELRTSEPDVRVRTVKFYPLTKETDVELKVALTYKGSTKNAPEYEFNFTIENDKEIIEEGQTEAASYGNIYLEADATVRNVTFQGDEDEIVFATKTVVKGQKYYFNVTSELEKEDEQIIADNPEVDSIYTVYQNNMANATVQFKNLDREFFVYNEDGKLLGTTKDSKLPLAKKYILTTAKVDFGGEEEPTEEAPEVEEPEAPPMGGGEVVETPNTYNPNTGL